jgi:K+-sensing histidine kinase KdpD
VRPEQVVRVFDKFCRADAPKAALEGLELGLGMSIV